MAPAWRVVSPAAIQGYRTRYTFLTTRIREDATGPEKRRQTKAAPMATSNRRRTKPLMLPVKSPSKYRRQRSMDVGVHHHVDIHVDRGGVSNCSIFAAMEVTAAVVNVVMPNLALP